MSVVPRPAPVGLPLVFTELKSQFGILRTREAAETTLLPPDRFPVFLESPLGSAHVVVSGLLEEALVALGQTQVPNLQTLSDGRRILQLKEEERGAVLLALCERHWHAEQRCEVGANPVPSREQQQALFLTGPFIRQLLLSEFSLPRPGVFDLLLYLSQRPSSELHEVRDVLEELTEQTETFQNHSELTEGESYVLTLLDTDRSPDRKSLREGRPSKTENPPSAAIGRPLLTPGEVWADAVNHDMTALPSDVEVIWRDLFTHLGMAHSSRPSKKWLKTAQQHLDQIGGSAALESIIEWLALASESRLPTKMGRSPTPYFSASSPSADDNSDTLRGLLWLVPLLPDDPQVARRLTAIALSSYKKLPGIGPRAPKIGNAAVYSLSQMGTTDAVGQLAVLKTRVKLASAQKEIEKAFRAAAEALNLPREEIEEIGVPTFDLDEGGTLTEQFEDYTATIQISGTSAELTWTNSQGKPLKSIPAKVRNEHKDDLKDLKQTSKDLQSQLLAQRDRLDSLILSQQTWSYQVWKERYLDHPVVGAIARRLIWNVDGAPALFLTGTAEERAGNAVSHGQTADVSLWHPVGKPIDEVLAWRGRLEEVGITQPFKQAHREVYLLTEAERRTETYSNRFAAHVLRQHQFHALCAARGWKNKLRLMVDDVFPPAMKELPKWGLRAEFWIESVGDEFGRDTNDAGVYLHVATDQVRFHPLGDDPNLAHAWGGGYHAARRRRTEEAPHLGIPLEEIPPLVFSEIMRDVDLFVGVASVGNDPTWQDGGPEGRFRDYWQTYSFGELSGTAKTRKQVLEKLVPRLKIASRCRLSDRFLVVQGDLRTYKIHLGSGNILMEPNDQYLCIVPNSRQRSKDQGLFLPFEGDNMLSIILSKAFLLAEDRKIKDPTITLQLEMR